MTITLQHDAVLSFWFEDITPAQWFRKNEAFDAEVKNKFFEHVEAALLGEYDHWAVHAEGKMALILLLDQMTRNIYRDTVRAFFGDPAALKHALVCVEDGTLKQAPAAHQSFMLMPLMHSENLDIQDLSLPLFEAYTDANTLKYAQRHRDIVARFGRFPHRNDILGRHSTTEELEFLQTPGSSF